MMTQLSQQNSVLQDPISDVDVLETTMQLQLDLKAEKKVGIFLILIKRVGIVERNMIIMQHR